MEIMLFMIPMAFLLGLMGLGAFFWAMKTGQYDDIEGNAERILFEDDKKS